MEDDPSAGIYVLGVLKRPDLIDRTDKMVWEIKPASLANYVMGYNQLGAYIALLNIGDVRCLLHGECWERGDGRYVPTPVVVTPLSIAKVFPPVNGVIGYERMSLKKAYLLFGQVAPAAANSIMRFIAMAAEKCSSLEAKYGL
jgi:hypothetical protein